MTLATDIWIVLVEDHHRDVDALPFTSKEAATETARKKVVQFAWYPEEVTWDAILTDRQVEDGVVFYAEYGTEGDCVSVFKRALDMP